MSRTRRFLAQPGFKGLVAGLGALLFSWPHLASFHLWPAGLVFIYLFAAWALLIVLLFLIGRTGRGPEGSG